MPKPMYKLNPSKEWYRKALKMEEQHCRKGEICMKSMDTDTHWNNLLFPIEYDMVPSTADNFDLKVPVLVDPLTEWLIAELEKMFPAFFIASAEGTDLDRLGEQVGVSSDDTD